MSRERVVVDFVAVRDGRARLAALGIAHPELLGASSPENVTAWESTLSEQEIAPMPTKEMIQTGFRLPKELVDRVDAYALAISRPGLPATRADAVRVLLTVALNAHESEQGPPKKATKPKRV